MVTGSVDTEKQRAKQKAPALEYARSPYFA